LKSRVVWEFSPNLGSRFYLKLKKIIIVWKPIVKKYSDGKVKRTLKRATKKADNNKKKETKRLA